ncbi:GntR family transcriptional regulator [Klebsiella variicola subsp. variicola]|nr:GntR family transcriptional regulator [Klebsiella variicola subsp. variicola]
MVMQTNPSHAATEDTAAARSEVIRQFLRHILVAQRVPKGLVLLEGPLAQLFGTSRVPVRRALSLLHEEGLITRFEGRGFIVAQPDEEVEPLRLALTRELFGLDEQQPLVDTRTSGEKVLENLQVVLSTAMVFGCYSVNEQKSGTIL